jgi:exodeoxyribonuclease VII large subunit
VLARRATRASPSGGLARDRQRVDDQLRRAHLAAAGRLRAQRERLAGQGLRLAALDPTRVLARGYAIVTVAPAGALVRSAHQVQAGDDVRIRVADGAFDAVVGGAAALED